MQKVGKSGYYKQAGYRIWLETFNSHRVLQKYVPLSTLYPKYYSEQLLSI